MEQAKRFIEFVGKSPTAFHAAEVLCEMLDGAGFSRLNEIDRWEIRRGGKYYVTRNQSALIAFAVPDAGFRPMQIVASHSDSPTFKLKPIFEDATADYVRLNVEKYGGGILSTWLDRPLSVAGRAAVRTENGVSMRLFDLARDAVLIPNMPIHFNREVNDGYKFSVQKDMLPLYGDGSAKGGLMREIAEEIGVSEGDIISGDYFLYNRMAGSIWGAANEFFSVSRIDDLECAYASVCALTEAENIGNINVCAVLDNEEVGSGSRQGADSTFLIDTYRRIGSALGATDDEIVRATAGSFLVSADNAHALHPNHTDKYDAQNRVAMNGGIVVKHSAAQTYTTDGASDAVFSEICRRAGVSVQHFANHSDIRGGGTLGAVSGSHVSVCSVDIGLAQLAMHSSFETAGTRDLDEMIKGLKGFYDTRIEMTGDGSFTLY
ncbi:MAG: M18 family aminopeptidase [Christensenellales bacterium]|jgi:aspartyl aminopeptidase